MSRNRTLFNEYTQTIKEKLQIFFDKEICEETYLQQPIYFATDVILYNFLFMFYPFNRREVLILSYYDAENYTTVFPQGKLIQWLMRPEQIEKYHRDAIPCGWIMPFIPQIYMLPFCVKDRSETGCNHWVGCVIYAWDLQTIYCYNSLESDSYFKSCFEDQYRNSPFYSNEHNQSIRFKYISYCTQEDPNSCGFYVMALFALLNDYYERVDIESFIKRSQDPMWLNFHLGSEIMIQMKRVFSISVHDTYTLIESLDKTVKEFKQLKCLVCGRFYFDQRRQCEHECLELLKQQGKIHLVNDNPTLIPLYEKSATIIDQMLCCCPVIIDGGVDSCSKKYLVEIQHFLLENRVWMMLLHDHTINAFILSHFLQSYYFSTETFKHSSFNNDESQGVSNNFYENVDLEQFPMHERFYLPLVGSQLKISVSGLYLSQPCFESKTPLSESPKTNNALVFRFVFNYNGVLFAYKIYSPTKPQPRKKSLLFGSADGSQSDATTAYSTQDESPDEQELRDEIEKFSFLYDFEFHRDNFIFQQVEIKTQQRVNFITVFLTSLMIRSQKPLYPEEWMNLFGTQALVDATMKHSNLFWNVFISHVFLQYNLQISYFNDQRDKFMSKTPDITHPRKSSSNSPSVQRSPDYNSLLFEKNVALSQKSKKLLKIYNSEDIEEVQQSHTKPLKFTPIDCKGVFEKDNSPCCVNRSSKQILFYDHQYRSRLKKYLQTLNSTLVFDPNHVHCFKHVRFYCKNSPRTSNDSNSSSSSVPNEQTEKVCFYRFVIKKSVMFLDYVPKPIENTNSIELFSTIQSKIDEYQRLKQRGKQRKDRSREHSKHSKIFYPSYIRKKIILSYLSLNSFYKNEFCNKSTLGTGRSKRDRKQFESERECHREANSGFHSKLQNSSKVNSCEDLARFLQQATHCAKLSTNAHFSDYIYKELDHSELRISNICQSLEFLKLPQSCCSDSSSFIQESQSQPDLKVQLFDSQGGNQISLKKLCHCLASLFYELDYQSYIYLLGRLVHNSCLVNDTLILTHRFPMECFALLEQEKHTMLQTEGAARSTRELLHSNRYISGLHKEALILNNFLHQYYAFAFPQQYVIDVSRKSHFLDDWCYSCAGGTEEVCLFDINTNVYKIVNNSNDCAPEWFSSSLIYPSQETLMNLFF